MAGIYLHIPFCKQACNYCDFHFSTTMKMKVDFVKAIIQEIELRKDVFANKFISSIYFGGGTPSLLSKEELDMIFENIFHYGLDDVREFMCNDGTVIPVEWLNDGDEDCPDGEDEMDNEGDTPSPADLLSMADSDSDGLRI